MKQNNKYLKISDKFKKKAKPSIAKLMDVLDSIPDPGASKGVPIPYGRRGNKPDPAYVK